MVIVWYCITIVQGSHTTVIKIRCCAIEKRYIFAKCHAKRRASCRLRARVNLGNDS